MAAPTYASLTAGLTREQVLDIQLGVLKGPDFRLPVQSWGAFDEPYATLAADAEVLKELSLKIAEIAKAGVTADCRGELLTIHAKDVFDEDRELGVVTKGQVKFTETAGNPGSWSAGELLFVDKNDDSVVLKNTGSVSLAALGEVTFEIAAEEIGTKGNLDASDLKLTTELPGITLTVASGTSWITQSGTDDETDERLIARCAAKWGTLSTTGAADAYRKWALDASATVNRVFVQEDPLADQTAGDPSVTVIVASEAGAVAGTVITTVNTYVQARRPLGVLVEVISASLTTFTLKGTVTVKASKRAAAEVAINDLLDAWFAGRTITVNGEELLGLQIGDRVRISQVIEIVMSVPGVVGFTPKKSDGTTIYAIETDDLVLAGDAVASLSRSLTYSEVT